jgi:thiol-disulfide isomerase/thioredoxin
MKKLAAILILAFAIPGAMHPQSVKAPILELKDLKGRTVRLTDFKGKTVLLNFWATWCVPCRAEIPQLVKWQREYKSKGLQIVGITYPPTNRARVDAFAGSNKMNYPILFGGKSTKLLFSNSEALPISVIIDKDGNIRDTIEGIIYEDEFDQKVKPLLIF